MHKTLTINDIEHMIGLPWEQGSFGPESFDCWGLVYKCLEMKGYKDLPSVDYTFPEGESEEFNKGKSDSHWKQAGPDSKNVIALFYRGEVAQHIGIIVDGFLLNAIGRKNKGSVQLTRLAAVNKLYTRTEFFKWHS